MTTVFHKNQQNRAFHARWTKKSRLIVTTAMTTALSISGYVYANDGFSITVDDQVVAGDPALAPPPKPPKSNDSQVATIRTPSGPEITSTYEGVGVEKNLTITRISDASTYREGEVVEFETTVNYARFLKRSEIRIYKLDGINVKEPIGVVDAPVNGKIGVRMPSGAERLAIAYRVYDARGRFDETAPIVLYNEEKLVHNTFVKEAETIQTSDEILDENIHVRGGIVAVRVTNLQPGQKVMIHGQLVEADTSGVAEASVVVPIGTTKVEVVVYGRDGERRYDQPITVPSEDTFYTAQIDITHRRSLDGGDSETTGRITGYFDREGNNGEHLTIGVDTGEDQVENLFKDSFSKDPDDVVNRMDPNDGYQEYGDDSTIESKVDTGGKIYLNYSKDEDYLLIGNFNPELGGSRYIVDNKSSYGMIANVQSKNNASDGDPAWRVMAYAATADDVAGRDAFLGNGTTLYFLDHQDINPTSGIVRIETRDAQGHVISSRTLKEGVDYRIDTLQGIIVLREPLDAMPNDPAIVGAEQLGYQQYLVAEYDYKPVGSDPEAWNAGGRVEAAPVDNLRVGLSASRKKEDEFESTVISADAQYNFNKESYIRAEVAQSEGTTLGEQVSIDGGLNFSPSTIVGEDVKASAVYVETHINLPSLGVKGIKDGYVEAYYEDLEEGFLNSGSAITSDTERYGAIVDVDVNDTVGLRIQGDNTNTAAGFEASRISADVDLAINEQLTAEVGVTTETVKDPASVHVESQRTAVGGRITYSPDSALSAYAFGEKTVDYTGSFTAFEQFGIGLDAQLNDVWSIDSEIYTSNSGEGGHILATRDYGNGEYSYVGYRVDPIGDYISGVGTSKDGQFVTGHIVQHNAKLRSYSEFAFDLSGENQKTSQVFGLYYAPYDNVTVGVSYEGAKLRGNDYDDIERNAVAVDAAYNNNKDLQGSFRVEYRNDDSENDEHDLEFLGIVAQANYQVDPDWRLYLEGEGWIAKSNGTDFVDSRYARASMGGAYRPVKHDKVNGLYVFSYINDQQGTLNSDLAGGNTLFKHRGYALSGDINYKPDDKWTIGGKIGYRFTESAPSGTNDWDTSRAGVAVLRFDYHLMHEWDVSMAYRTFWAPDVENYHSGALATYYHVNENFKLGVGYDWGVFSEDILEFEGTDDGLFLNAVAKF